MHTLVCWHTALLGDINITVLMAQVDEASLAPHSAQHHGSVQQKKSFTGQISSTHFEVILTASLEQISQNGPKTKN